MRAYARFTYSWLSSKEALTQTNVARVQPLSQNGLAQGEHIRGSSTDSVDLQLADGVDQQGGLAHSKGYDGGSCGLQVLMVRVAAHPKAVIETVNHRIARSQPRSPVGTGCTFIHQGAILAGEGDIERTTRRTRGLVHPNHLLLVGRQITAKGRVFVLAAPAFILLGKREKW